ncbi:hypothetical protein ABZ342_09705 [Amycolatopsis sp. NPDC005961]|uniref:hypothetical protein n=1 Tax=Amycolatopsis sp. NPDC005961 TaxID=3156720 RepID=UPI0034034572
MPRDPHVHFPAFRHHEEARQEANNAMMALLVGAQVSAQFLELSRGSSKLLSEIFPGISHIKRLDLRPEAAQSILRGAEQHLGAMAVPQALAIHEGFILDCLDLLGVQAVKAFKMHAELATRASSAFDADLLSRFHVLREMRNAIIHRSGTADHRLIAAIGDLTPAGDSEWKKHAGRSPVGIRGGDRVTFMLGELVLTLATTKALAREANRMLIKAIPSASWAEVIVDDHLQQTTKKLDPRQRRRAILGLRRFSYAVTSVSDAELEVAAAARGVPMT